MANELTDKAFWVNYWESKKGLAFKVPGNYTFHKLIKNIVDEKHPATAVELGGFPGYYAIFLKKYFGLKKYHANFFIEKFSKK